MLRHRNTWRSSGPDNIGTSVLKTYSKELAPSWQAILFTRHTHCPHSLEDFTHIIPLPNKPCPKGCKNFGLAALTIINISISEYISEVMLGNHLK